MSLRLHVIDPLHAGQELDLDSATSRHVQVLRLQPGSPLVLFNGQGGEWSAQVLAMGRQTVRVAVLAHQATTRELACEVSLAVGAPANDRFDWLIEKATELGAARILPLHTERSVARWDGERALKKLAHWNGVARAAAEQSGRTVVPEVLPPSSLKAFLAECAQTPDAACRALLSPSLDAPTWAPWWRAQDPDAARRLWVLSGPEGGLGPQEEAAAQAAGFAAVSLGPRILRAETAPLAVLAALGLAEPGPAT